MGLRAASKPVEVSNECHTTNIGVYDQLSLGRAQDLGDGRIFQTVGDSGTRVFLADCNTREATVLRGPIVSEYETSCGPSFDFESLTGATATIDLTSGEDLHELVEVAEAAGAFELSPLEMFFKFDIFLSSRGFDDEYDVGRKDRFNLLCGCGRLYPNSAGASQ